MAAANLFVNKFGIRLEKNISGLNGHGPVDFGLDIAKTNKIIGVTEVKAKDFMQGIAQNLMQCESALSNDGKVLESLQIPKYGSFRSVHLVTKEKRNSNYPNL